MATLKGAAVVWGCGFTSTVGIVLSSTTGEVQSADFTREATQTELRDHLGDPIGMAYTNFKRTWNVSVVPCAASVVGADGAPNPSASYSLDSFLPTPGTAVKVVDATSGITDNADLGVGWDFMVEEASVKYSNTGHAVVDLVLASYEDTDLVTAS